MFSTASVKRVSKLIDRICVATRWRETEISFAIPVLMIALCLLAGCGGTAPRPEVHYKTVPVVVTAPCVVDRPEKPTGLKAIIPDEQWAQMPTGAKAQAVKAQAGRRLNYEDRLEAATAGCR